MNEFEVMLTGGHPNSLGRTVEVVELVLADPSRMRELYACYFSADEVVRLRTSNALKRISRTQPALLIPYLDGLLDEIAQIDQPSAQWTLAQIFGEQAGLLTVEQKQRAAAVLQGFLERASDWIVLNQTLQTLSEWAVEDAALRAWLLPHAERLAQDARKSVSKRAREVLKRLGGG